MDAASVIVVVIATFTIGTMFFSRFNPVIVLAVGLIASFLVSSVFTGIVPGWDQSTIWAELGFHTSYYMDLSHFYLYLSYIFLHKDVWHLLFNLVFLFVAGIPLIRRMSNVNFVIMILLGNAIATFLYTLTVSAPQLIIGSSTTVAVIIGVLFVLYPRLEIVLPKPIGYTGVKVWMPAILWLFIEVMSTLGIGDANDTTAYGVHVIGFAVGASVGLISRSKYVPFDITTPSKQYIDVTLLKQYCVTDNQVKVYNRVIENSDPAQRDAGARYIATLIQCPVCGSRFTVLRGNIVCPNGHIIQEFSKMEKEKKKVPDRMSGKNIKEI